MIATKDGFYTTDRDLFLAFCDLDQTYRGYAKRRPAVRRNNCPANIKQNEVIDQLNGAEGEQNKAMSKQSEVTAQQQPLSKPFRSATLIAGTLGCSCSKVEQMRTIRTYANNDTLHALETAAIGMAEAYKNAMEERKIGLNARDQSIRDDKYARTLKLILEKGQLFDFQSIVVHRLSTQDYTMLGQLLDMLLAHHAIDWSNYEELQKILQQKKNCSHHPTPDASGKNGGAS